MALVACGWAGVRIAILWPEGATLPEAVEAAFPLRLSEAATVPVTPPMINPAPLRVELAGRPSPFVHIANLPLPVRRSDQERIDLAVLGLVHFGPEQAVGVPPGAIPPAPSAPVMLPLASAPDRWSASAWFVTRRGAPASGAMLGGDQAGLRVAFTPGGDGRLAFHARVTAPQMTAGRELAAGVEWRPTSLPVRVVAEHRIGLDGNRGGPAIGVVGGVDRVPLPFDFRLEAYGQAGAVARRRIEPFADAMVRVTREIASSGQTRLDAGVAVWGAAQRDVARLDLGPGAVATLPLGDRAVRVAIDWRERTAGDARPGSGPALTIGADF